MKFNKRDKAHGRLCSKEEVLRELGNPSSWCAHHLKIEFENRLRQGQTELCLTNIKGYPGKKGYLSLLETELKDPLGSRSGLISEEENTRILEDNRKLIQGLIDKYRALLEQYEKDPEQIYIYIGDMQWWLDFTTAMDKWSSPRESYNDPELDEFFANADKQAAKDMEDLKQQIAAYTTRYEQMTGQKLDLSRHHHFKDKAKLSFEK